MEPVALAPEDMCSYCRMAISEKRYAAELLDSDGRAFKFDDIGCMSNFVNKREVKAMVYFVMDFDERTWIRAEDAFYVRSAEITTPMNGGIVAFQTEAKARQAAGKYHGTVQRFDEVQQ
jgi:copper chaperone NosL